MSALKKCAQIPWPESAADSVGNERDPGLATEEALRRSVAQTRRTGAVVSAAMINIRRLRNGGSRPVCMRNTSFPADVQTVAGETIPRGTKAANMFPDGMYIAMIEGVDAPVQSAQRMP